MKTIVLVLLAIVCATQVSARLCNNITGTCFGHGFVCANDQVVKHSQRCDGVEDCSDGSDEFMCDLEDHRPLHIRTSHERHAFEQASCIRCNCAVATLTITSSSPWFPFAVVSPTDPAGLMTGASNVYGGLPCNSQYVSGIVMRFYKKSGICRGWLCCARQMRCSSCTNGMNPDPYRCYRA